MRTPFLLLAALFTLASSAFAGLEIKKARYGNTAAYHDVRGIVEAYVRNNTLSFLVSARSLGGDPSGPSPDYLFIIYEVNGHEFTDTVPDGDVFTFKGIPGVRPVQPPLNLPFLKPAPPTTALVSIVNRTRHTARAYNVDRFGRWNWAADVPPGRTVNLRGRIGEEWVVAGEHDRVLARDRIGRGENILVAAPGEPHFHRN